MTFGEEILGALIEVLDDIQHGGTILPHSTYEVPDPPEKQGRHSPETMI